MYLNNKYTLFSKIKLITDTGKAKENYKKLEPQQTWSLAKGDH
jgi:hypothetical protein